MASSWEGNLPTELKEKVGEVDKVVEPRLEETGERAFYSRQRVLDLFGKHRAGGEDLVPSTGCGYDSVGRDKLEVMYAGYFKTDNALVRPQFSPTTHTIAVSLFSMLRPDDTLYYLTGMPYNTIREVAGLAGNKPGNMGEQSIDFKHTDLLGNDEVDYDQTRKDLQDLKIRTVTIQCFLGYAVHVSLTMEKIKKMLKFIKEIRPNVEIFVDNCYGEFSETGESTFYGVDMIVELLFKNAGTSIVKASAFLVDKKDLVEGIGSRFNAPGAGREEGTTRDYLRDMYQNFFTALHTAGEALKGIIYIAALCGEIGMKVALERNDPRTDIVQAVTFGESDPMVKFCVAVQHYSPMSSFVDPIPHHQDGHEDGAVMAPSSFTEGSTIELSSDGPLRIPCRLYIQGGLSYTHDRIAITHIVEETLYKKD